MLSPEKAAQFAAVLECLKTAFDADTGAIHSLMAMRVPTNGAMLDHPDIIVRQEEIADYISLSPLGIINGILTSIGLPRICMKFEEIDVNDAKHKSFRFAGFDTVPMDQQPDNIQKEMATFEKLAAMATLPTPDQKLWEFLGLATQTDIDAGGKYDRIIGEVEEYFGVGSGMKSALTKGDLAIKALQELVDTKNMKDSAGKTPEYEARRLAAWEQAEQVLITKEKS